MFRTKMNENNNKLNNGKTIKIILIVIFVFILVAGALFYISSVKFRNEMSDNAQINELFRLKETYIGDAPKVRAIADMANFTEFNIAGIELKTDAEPYRLTINFMVDNRKNHRKTKEKGLNTMSGMIFALVQNVDEILYNFYDEYSEEENKDDSFFAAYYTRENLCERIEGNVISFEDIESSVRDIKSFEQYYNTLLSTEKEVKPDNFIDRVNEFIGEDYEIVANSSIGAEFTIDSLPENDVKMLEKILDSNAKIGQYYGSGITVNLITYDVKNFKTDEYKKCAFLYHIHHDMGFVVIGESFITDIEFNELKNFIITEQTENK